MSIQTSSLHFYPSSSESETVIGLLTAFPTQNERHSWWLGCNHKFPSRNITGFFWPEREVVTQTHIWHFQRTFFLSGYFVLSGINTIYTTKPTKSKIQTEILATLLRPSWEQKQGGFFGRGRPKQQLCSKPSLQAKAKDNLPQQVPIIGYFWQGLVSYIIPNIHHFNNEKNARPI